MLHAPDLGEVEIMRRKLNFSAEHTEGHPRVFLATRGPETKTLDWDT